MDTNIAIAIIAAVSSLFVSIVSFIAVILSNRQSARSAKDLESIRNHFSRLAAADSLSDEYLATSLDSLRTALQVIQRMKDEIQLVLSAVETSLDTETCLKNISKVREELFSKYEQDMANLDDVEAHVFHRAKNHALRIENFLKTNLADKEFVSFLSNEQKATLRELRNELSDIQYALRDRRSERLARRIANYGK